MAENRSASELENYVLNDASNGQPVSFAEYECKAYSLQTMHEEKYQKAMAASQLMRELNADMRSVEEEG